MFPKRPIANTQQAKTHHTKTNKNVPFKLYFGNDSDFEKHSVYCQPVSYWIMLLFTKRK